MLETAGITATPPNLPNLIFSEQGEVEDTGAITNSNYVLVLGDGDWDYLDVPANL
jgi:hypothetical protein